MSITMNQKKAKALANELAKDLKTPEDLSALSAQVMKMTVEAALNGEMSHHLGYEPHEASGKNTGNSRNGYSHKTLKGDHGEIEIEVPRDRNATFAPQTVAKGQTRIRNRHEITSRFM